MATTETTDLEPIDPERTAEIASPAPGLSSRRRSWTFGVLVAMAAMTILDVSKVGVALPAIQASSGGGSSSVQLMLVGYTIAYAVFLLPSGRLGDLISRRTVFLVGAGIFTTASLICAIAPDPLWLIIGRIVEGAGAGLLMPQVLGLIQRTYPADQRSRPLATMAAVTAATGTFGPVFAGLVMQAVGTPEAWRALFWINVIAGVILIPIAVGVVRDPPTERKRGFDWRGVLMLVPAVALAIFPLSTISQENPPAWWMLVSSIVGIGLAVLFAQHERRLTGRGGQALVDPQLFRFAHFAPGVSIAGLLHAAGTSSALVMTLFLQQYIGLTALETALWMLPSALATIAGSIVAGRLPQSRSFRLIMVGTAIGTASLLAVAFTFGSLPAALVPPVLCGILFINGFGGSLVGAPNQARSLLVVPSFRASIAGSVIQFSQRTGSAIGLAVAMILYYTLGTGVVGFSGRETLGPTVALCVTAAITFGAFLVAVRDRDRSLV
jgi:MFS family permease